MRRMGGLWRKMPLVANTFVIGAAALAGVPLLNGFWSKELILETALHNGYGWVYAILVLVAGLTAAYTVRMVWFVFLSRQQSPVSSLSVSQSHPVPTAMQLPLAILALGTLL